MSCSPSGQQVALKMAGMCISCGAYRRAVTISLTAGQLVATDTWQTSQLSLFGSGTHYFSP